MATDNKDSQNLDFIDLEVVDIHTAKPDDIDLQLDDEPYEICMDVIEKMQAEEEEARNNTIDIQFVDDPYDKSDSRKPAKDIMLKDPDDIMDAFKTSKTKKWVLIWSLVILVATLIPLWIVREENLFQTTSNILNGSLIVDAASVSPFIPVAVTACKILGKVFVIAVIAIIALMLINLRMWSMRIFAVASALYVLQNILEMIAYCIYYNVSILAFIPFGFIVATAGLVLLFMALKRNNKVQL